MNALQEGPDGSRLQRILVVDDEADICRVAQVALQSIGGYIVECCESGAEALQRAAELRPDLILLDVMMPGLDGPATLARLREDPRLERIPVVFLTARAASEDLRRFRELTVLDTLLKPFEPRDLCAAIAELWRHHQARSAETADSARVRSRTPR